MRILWKFCKDARKDKFQRKCTLRCRSCVIMLKATGFSTVLLLFTFMRQTITLLKTRLYVLRAHEIVITLLKTPVGFNMITHDFQIDMHNAHLLESLQKLHVRLKVIESPFLKTFLNTKFSCTRNLNIFTKYAFQKMKSLI